MEAELLTKYMAGHTLRMSGCGKEKGKTIIQGPAATMGEA